MTLTLPDLGPTQITVMTTSNCTARCGHCSVRSGPDRFDFLSLAGIVGPIDALIEDDHQIELVIFAGGEPTVLGDVLLEAIAEMSTRGVLTRVVTNGSWATSHAAARDTLIEFREAGLAEINISADDFHLPFIPLERVVTAWHASKGLGFQSVALAVSHSPRSRVTPEVVMAAIGERPALAYDADGRGLPLPEPGPDGTRYLLANHLIYRIGRGRRLPESWVTRSATENFDVPCPWAIKSAAISPKGHLVACCGIEAEDNEVLDFGSLEQDPVEALLSAANADPIVRAIAEIGPLRTLKLARRLNPSLAVVREPATLCEACEDLVTDPDAVATLRANYPAVEAERASALTAVAAGARSGQLGPRAEVGGDA